MLWGDEENIPLKDFIEVSQMCVVFSLVCHSHLHSSCSSLVDIFSPTSTSLSRPIKDALIKYYSLLHYTSITHSTLESLYPSPPLSSCSVLPQTTPSLADAFLKFLIVLTSTILHPRFLLFLPPFMCHTPAYLTGYLAGRFLVPPGDEESKAQFKAVFAGIGFGLEVAHITRNVILWLTSTKGDIGENWARNVGVEGILRWCRFEGVLKNLEIVLAGGDGSLGGNMRRMLVIGGLYYATALALSRWHNALVDG
jgi:glycerol-3-phosphate O-acyltransferase / dihydroxyacetone phosphate acyltransferase